MIHMQVTYLKGTYVIRENRSSDDLQARHGYENEVVSSHIYSERWHMPHTGLESNIRRARRTVIVGIEATYLSFRVKKKD